MHQTLTGPSSAQSSMAGQIAIPIGSRLGAGRGPCLRAFEGRLHDERAWQLLWHSTAQHVLPFRGVLCIVDCWIETMSHISCDHAGVASERECSIVVHLLIGARCNNHKNGVLFDFFARRQGRTEVGKAKRSRSSDSGPLFHARLREGRVHTDWSLAAQQLLVGRR